MHRPTRQHRHLKVKLEHKLARSRNVGPKARRWKKWLAHYQALSDDGAAADAPADAPAGAPAGAKPKG